MSSCDKRQIMIPFPEREKQGITGRFLDISSLKPTGLVIDLNKVYGVYNEVCTHSFMGYRDRPFDKTWKGAFNTDGLTVLDIVLEDGLLQTCEWRDDERWIYSRRKAGDTVIIGEVGTHETNMDLYMKDQYDHWRSGNT